MIRFCVSCRNRKPSQLLVPFHSDLSGRLLLGRGTRSAWVCMEKECLLQLKHHPKKASRSLKTKVVDSNKCLQQVQNLVKRDIYKNIVHAKRSGNVYSGRNKIMRHQDSIHILILSQSSDNQHKKNYWKTLIPKSNLFTIDISQKKLGSLVNKGSRCALGVSPNRHAQQLVEHLHQYNNLR